MDLTKIPLMSALTTRMTWLTQRQRVLAQNIANANTPGYQPLDLTPPDFKSLVARARAPSIGMTVNDGAHLPGSHVEDRYETQKAGGYEVTPTGNSVVLEEQVMKVAETRMDYQTAMNLYRKQISMIRTALGARN